jgi:lipopolysaccharide transport system permease protein
MDRTERTPYKIIRRARGLQSISLRELWQYRDLMTTLAGRDIQLRYRQTALGAAWVVLQPLLAAGVFSFVFGRVARLPSDGLPYFLFAYVGLLAWNAFSNTVSKFSTCLVVNAHLVSKVAFPRLILPLSNVFGTLIDFSVALVMLAVQMIYFHIAPGPGILLLPVWLALTLMLAMGVGLITAALNVSYRDVQYIIPVLLQIVMYASPVAYALSAVPEKLRVVYMLNPISILMEGFRTSILGRGSLSPATVAYAALTSIGVFVFGAFAFRQMERRFADVI